MKRWNEEVKESECERIVKVEPRPSRCDKDNHFRNTNKNRGKNNRDLQALRSQSDQQAGVTIGGREYLTTGVAMQMPPYYITKKLGRLPSAIIDPLRLTCLPMLDE